MEKQPSTTETYPCVVCGISVGWRQVAVECDSCGRWQHMKCDTGISWKQYREATKRDEAIPFMCRQCRTEETRQTGEGPSRQLSSDLEELPEDMQPTVEEEAQMTSMVSEEGNVELRKKYLDLLAQVQDYRDEGGASNTHTIQMLLLKANEVFEDVKRPREAAIDSQVLKACGELAKVQIESSSTSVVEFRPRDFAEKLTSWLMEEDEDDVDDEDEEGNVDLLARLGRITQHLKRSVSGIEPFLNTMECEERKSDGKKLTRRGACKFASQKKVMVAVQKGDESRETLSVTWKLKILKERYVLNGNKPLCFCSFFLDPFSFSRTIENLFHISLLVHDSHVEILKGKDGLPLIRPRTGVEGSQSEGNHESERDHDNQSVLCMDVDDWKELIKIFNITTPMIPPLKNSPLKRTPVENPLVKKNTKKRQ